jgi:carboxyl-terminal processing protease
MRRNVRRAAVLLVFATAGCGQQPSAGSVRAAPPAATSNLAIPQSSFRAEFDAVLAGIDEHYALKQEKGIDVGALRARFGPDVDAAATPEAFYATLVRVFASLRNSHSDLLLPSQAFFEAGFGAVLVEGRLLLTGEITDPSLSDHGVGRGHEVIAIDDVPFPQWLADRGQMANASTPQYERVAAAQQATRRFWFEPARRRFVFRSPAGTSLTLELSLERSPGTFGRLPLVSGRAVEEVGYVAVNSLTGDVVAQFEAELSRVLDRRALVLDLRRNRGGDSALALPIMSHLITQPARVHWPTQQLQPAASLRFAGPLAVLVGPITHSAAESLAHNLKDAGRGTFIGTETAGSSGNGPQAFTTAGGVVFRVPTRSGQERSVSGAPTEGFGLVPHVTSEQTYLDYLAGRDTVLERAIAVLQGSARP